MKSSDPYRKNPRPSLGPAKAFNLFGGDKEQTSVASNTNDSFNRYDTVTNTTENAGNTSLAIGGNGAAENLPLLIVAGAVLGGLALILTR